MRRAMASMLQPTASADKRMPIAGDDCGTRAKMLPESSPIRWPPITLRGAAKGLWGLIKTINAVAPIALITTTFSLPRIIAIIKMAKPAKALCQM